jgi:hypothetical protein
MALGTAPRRRNGVWYTAKGRKLSADGQRYWEQLHKAGTTDGEGHITTTRPEPLRAETPALTAALTARPKRRQGAPTPSGPTAPRLRGRRSEPAGQSYRWHVGRQEEGVHRPRVDECASEPEA